MKTTLPSLALLLAGLIMLARPTQAAVPGMKVLKLFSPQPVTEGAFGNACTMTERYAIVGEPGYIPAIKGAVHVYDATTGAFVRTLKPTVSAAGDGFGNGLAVNGSQLLVWAGDQNNSSVYLMDITTGKQLRRFLPSSGQDAFFFGWSMILTDRYAIISNPDDASSKGAVYIFDLATTNPPQKITPPDGASGDFFGAALHLHGSVLLVGSPKNSGKGAVYRFNIETAQFLSKIQPSTLGAGDRFGDRIGGWGASAFVSAAQQDTMAGTNAGSVYAVSMDGTFEATPFNSDPAAAAGRGFGWLNMRQGNLSVWAAGKSYLVADAARRTVLREIPSEQLGTTIYPDGWSLAGNRLLLSYAFDNTYGTEAGAAVLVQLMPEPLNGQTIASKGDSAPGAASITFNDLSTAAINGTGRVAIGTSLSGTGSNAGKDRAVFDDLGAADLLDLAVKSRDDLGSGLKVASVAAPLMNDSNALIPVTLSGTGVNSTNNRSLLRDNGSAVTTLLRTGQTLAPFGAATLGSFSQLTQSDTTSNFASILALRSGVGGTTTANDSCFMLMRSDMPGTITGQEREGSASPIGGVNFGQFVRAAYQYNTAAYSAMLSGPAAQNQAFFTKQGGNASNFIIRKGDSAPGITGAVITSFLSENVNASSRLVLRAKVSGTGITTANNDGIWQQIGMSLALIARTGSQAPGQSMGVVWNRFLQVCPQTDRTIIRGQLRGTGITPANDELVCLLQEDGSMIVLMREGDWLAGSNGAKLGSIARLEVAASGQYRALVTLVGNSVSTANNLALIGGSTTNGTATTDSSLRKPWLMLRKGALISLNPLAPQVRVLSLAFTHSGSQDSTGMGCKGLPAVTGSGGTLVKATVTGGFTHLLRLE